MRFLLDTNVISEMIKASPDRKVLNWLVQNSSASAVSVVTIGEIWQGIQGMAEGKRKQGYQAWFGDVDREFGGRVIDIDVPLIKTWGDYCSQQKKRGFRPPVIDSLIAATALYHGLVLVTRNGDDFPGVTVVDPFE